jgi:hypothetical protein
MISFGNDLIDLMTVLSQIESGMAQMQGDVTTILHHLPTMDCILKDNSATVTRLPVPVEPALHDSWVLFRPSAAPVPRGDAIH